MSELAVHTESGERIVLSIVKSKRLRRLRLVVSPDGAASVHVPVFYLRYELERFVETQKRWIQKTVLRIRKSRQRNLNIKYLEGTRAEYLEVKSHVESLVRECVLLLSPTSVHKITIRIGNQKSRWGSCSRRGVLRFNYRIVYLPQELQYYIVAHELAHLTHMNHSPLFWKEVERLLPSYKQPRKELRLYRIRRVA